MPLREAWYRDGKLYIAIMNCGRAKNMSEFVEQYSDFDSEYFVQGDVQLSKEMYMDDAIKFAMDEGFRITKLVSSTIYDGMVDEVE